MKLFDLNPAERWLFVFAHPDDELAIAAWMRRLIGEERCVHAVWAHARGERGKEAENAASTIGLPLSHRFFLDFADGHMHRRIAEIERALSSIIQEAAPTRIVCAAYEQGHLDHDAIRLAISRVWDGPTAEFPEYWPYTPWVATMNRFAVAVGQEVLSLTAQEQEWKVKLARSYPSTAIWKNLWWYELWTALRGKRAHLRRTERLRWSPEHNFDTPNVPDKYRARVLRSKEWKAWSQAVSELRKA